MWQQSVQVSVYGEEPDGRAGSGPQTRDSSQTGSPHSLSLSGSGSSTRGCSAVKIAPSYTSCSPSGREIELSHWSSRLCSTNGSARFAGGHLGMRGARWKRDYFVFGMHGRPGYTQRCSADFGITCAAVTPRLPHLPPILPLLPHLTNYRHAIKGFSFLKTLTNVAGGMLSDVVPVEIDCFV